MSCGINSVKTNTAFKGYGSSNAEGSSRSNYSYVRPALQATATGAGTFGLYKGFMKLLGKPEGWGKRGGIATVALAISAWATDKVFRLCSGKKKEFIKEYNPLQEVYKELK